jgi:hypothetical protein
MIAAPTGWKIVKRVADHYTGFFGKVIYTVGSTERLSDPAALIMCERGFHYCPNSPVDCLQYVPGKMFDSSTMALVRVEAPPDATRVRERDKCAASALTISAVLPTSEALVALTGMVTSVHGDKEWYANGKLHREGNQPAVIRANGAQVWYVHGELHREDDQPAVIRANGDQLWYVHNKLHREGDQPAIVYANGDREWYVNSKLHREGDQPAVVYANGDREWYVNSKLHREGDQPAIIRANGDQEWYMHGKRREF